MRIVSSSKPRYPEQLRQAGVDGRVLVRFTVDTTGRVDPSSVKILTSTHDLFSRAVRESLAGFRFKPAEVNGRRFLRWRRCRSSSQSVSDSQSARAL